MSTYYEEGKIYDLTYVSLTIIGGSQYIVATDGDQTFTIRPYDYQIDYSIFPKVLSCYVRKLNYYGKPLFEQSKEQVLKDRYYQTGVTHEFVVSDILHDSKTDSTFYILSDEFGIQHRYYPNEEETLKKSGDHIKLFVKSIIPARDGKNNARLELYLPTEDLKKIEAAAAKPVYPKNTGKKNFGTENEKKEFKSSIVYPAGEIGPDIDKQLGIICRVIAGFMNAGGGTLYIGVSDNGYVCGIDNDYAHLNDGDDSFTYKQDDDHYLLKIMNTVCRSLGRIAATLVSMSIEEDEGKKYVVAEIQKASRPIWFEGNQLYVRMVVTNRKLSGDEITQFILDRISKTNFTKQKESEVTVVDSTLEETQESQPVEVAPAPKAPAKVARPGKAWRHITFYSNGEWSFQKDALEGDDVIFNAEVPSDAKQKNHILILAYENGRIDAVSLKDMLYGAKGLLPEGKRRGRGLCLENGTLVAAFCTNKKDMILVVSELAGEQYVKAMDVDTLGIHDAISKGNTIVRETGAKLVGVIHIPNDEGIRVALKGCGIFIEKNHKYTKGGVKLSTLTPNYQQLIGGLTALSA